jgi:serine/threonine-protein kinase HipA
LERTHGAGLSEFEYLVFSGDFSRQGALRFLDAKGQVIKSHHDAVPRLFDLEEITRLARAYEQGL